MNLENKIWQNSQNKIKNLEQENKQLREELYITQKKLEKCVSQVPMVINALDKFNAQNNLKCKEDIFYPF